MVTADSEAGFATPRIIAIPSDTPDVSSTAIRARAARGESLTDLVPPAVAAYIATHELYRTSPLTGEQLA
jgi:nicotinate-nucleotide adenylyltransferase